MTVLQGQDKVKLTGVATRVLLGATRGQRQLYLHPVLSPRQRRRWANPMATCVKLCISIIGWLWTASWCRQKVFWEKQWQIGALGGCGKPNRCHWIGRWAESRNWVSPWCTSPRSKELGTIDAMLLPLFSWAYLRRGRWSIKSARSRFRRCALRIFGKESTLM